MHCDILELERLRHDPVQTVTQIPRSLTSIESDFGLCGQCVEVVHRTLCVGSFLPLWMVFLYLHFYLERDSWLQWIYLWPPFQGAEGCLDH